ncbi:hypothetical protein EDEG_02574 [Edhazardia aedis USNM 41457]|uniref:Uncharacterized protein n=1 Tax=Edhazardia aedis (strain USNM 41457) TaxID=1003232 RepID=J9DNW2_EDHAE|nr:hypothetical protein EDEG_02574 [Edhazardia aedis USNM 41457]|eukprot:EJW03042.1 hypothetical protein EDEG_02574 [Edhazardia aedis USNM 41457]
MSKTSKVIIKKKVDAIANPESLYRKDSTIKDGCNQCGKHFLLQNKPKCFATKKIFSDIVGKLTNDLMNLKNQEFVKILYDIEHQYYKRTERNLEYKYRALILISHLLNNHLASVLSPKKNYHNVQQFSDLFTCESCLSS